MSRHGSRELLPLWYKNAIIYVIDIKSFQDSDGDGYGDLRGITQKLDYLSELGVNCLWLTPFYESPGLDNGYDVSDYYRVNPKMGTLDDFYELLHEAAGRGIRIITDLVVNHTSVDHPWFQAARRSRSSRFHDYYVWSDNPPAYGKVETIFPGEETSVWEYEPAVEAYYYHLFYKHQPDLDARNPEVMEEILKIADYWMTMGVSGFRVDAAPHLIQNKGATDGPDDDFSILERLHRYVNERRPHMVLLGETDIPPEEITRYFDHGRRLRMVFNFFLNNCLFLALARKDASPLVDALRRLPPLDKEGQWVNFLRNLDELDLEQLNDEEREEAYQEFAPADEMRIYGRGIRRRLAPMLGDRRRTEMAVSLLFSLPGAVSFVYGDEIGIGDDLSRTSREAVRVPMDWDAVQAQRADRGSLWHCVRKTMRARASTAEIGSGAYDVFATGNDAVIAHACTEDGKTLFAMHNLSDSEQEVRLEIEADEPPRQVLGSGVMALGERLEAFRLAPYAYCWYRLSEELRGPEIVEKRPVA